MSARAVDLLAERARQLGAVGASDLVARLRAILATSSVAWEVSAGGPELVVWDGAAVGICRRMRRREVAE